MTGGFDLNRRESVDGIENDDLTNTGDRGNGDRRYDKTCVQSVSIKSAVAVDAPAAAKSQESTASGSSKSALTLFANSSSRAGDASYGEASK